MHVLGINEKRRKLVETVVRHAPFDGWTDGTLRRVSSDIYHDTAVAGALFPDGMPEIVAYYLRDLDQRMTERLADRNLAAMKIRERIAAAVMARLEAAGPDREALRRLVSWFTLPAHAMFALRETARTADIIWQLAGDRSTDMNYYSKRLLLSGVLLSTLIYWLEDSSDRYADTRAFLDRRIADVTKLQGVRKNAEKFRQSFSAIFPAMI